MVNQAEYHLIKAEKEEERARRLKTRATLLSSPSSYRYRFYRRKDSEGRSTIHFGLQNVTEQHRKKEAFKNETMRSFMELERSNRKQILGQAEKDNVGIEGINDAMNGLDNVADRAMDSRRIHRKIRHVRQKRMIRRAHLHHQKSLYHQLLARSPKEEAGLFPRLSDAFHGSPSSRVLPWIIGILALLLVLFLILTLSGAVAAEGLTAMMASSYWADEEDLLAVEEHYSEYEAQLEEELRAFSKTHPGYDSYRYHLDAIGHDPYELCSILSSLLPGGFTLEEALPALQTVFRSQYTITTKVSVSEGSYRVPREGTVTITSPDGQVSTQSYSYYETVAYTYRTLEVFCVNHGLSAVAQSILSPDEWDLYSLTLENEGGYEHLF